jgi:cytochrome c oxidase subunit IV
VAHAQGQQVAAHAEGQQHPIGIYLKIWGLLFVLSIASYMVDYFHLQGLLRWSLIITFMLLKAGLIVAIFMHMKWERLALVYAIVIPPVLLLVLLGIGAIERTTLTSCATRSSSRRRRQPRRTSRGTLAEQVIERRDDGPRKSGKVDSGRRDPQRGWADFKKACRASSMAVGRGRLALLMQAAPTYTVPRWSAVSCWSHLLAIVFYALSRQIERGRPVDGAGRLAGGAMPARSRCGVALTLALGHSGSGSRRSCPCCPTAAKSEPGNPAGRRPVWPLHPAGARHFAVGGFFALIVFAFGVVTAPMLLDREVDVVTAALTSLRACLANPGATLVWAALIAVLTALGFATAMIGMVIIFPVLGHASWHAYRDLVQK